MCIDRLPYLKSNMLNFIISVQIELSSSDCICITTKFNILSHFTNDDRKVSLTTLCTSITTTNISRHIASKIWISCEHVSRCLIYNNRAVSTNQIRCITESVLRISIKLMCINNIISSIVIFSNKGISPIGINCSTNKLNCGSNFSDCCKVVTISSIGSSTNCFTNGIFSNI